MTEITDPAMEANATEYSSVEPPLLVELAQATREFSPGHRPVVRPGR